MIALAYKRFPVLPVMVASAQRRGHRCVRGRFNDLAKMMTSGYVSRRHQAA
ncbi:MAG: hypothetical protein ACLSAH_18425 [Bilophila wadsworthia]